MPELVLGVRDVERDQPDGAAALQPRVRLARVGDEAVEADTVLPTRLLQSLGANASGLRAEG